LDGVGEGGGVLGEYGVGDEAAAEGVQAGVDGGELAVEGVAEVGVGGCSGGVCDAEGLEFGEEGRDGGVYLGGGQFGAEEGVELEVAGLVEGVGVGAHGGVICYEGVVVVARRPISWGVFFRMRRERSHERGGRLT
jgi:hypothetical protein